MSISQLNNMRDYRILVIFRDLQAIDFLSGVSINYLLNLKEIPKRLDKNGNELEAPIEVDFGLKRVAMQRKLQWLVELGYLKHGIRDGRSNTYFITEEGLNLLDEADL